MVHKALNSLLVAFHIFDIGIEHILRKKTLKGKSISIREAK